jgi:DNA-binding transcriptional LysR family regulator
VDMLRDISWEALHAFAVFAQDGNFTRAARRLHLSQPALHSKIGNLARKLQIPLYVRRGRRIEITDAGRRVERFAHELREQAASFESELLGTGAQSPVVLSAGEGSYLYLLGPGIREFRAKSRRLLRLETAGAESSVDAVLSARAHLGVASLETIPSGLAAQPLTRVGQVLAMPARNALARHRAISLTMLRGADLIVPPAGRPHRLIIAQTLQSAEVEWRVAVEASGWELMLHFVRLGLGLAIVNACCRLPKGVVARPIPELPSLQYHVFHLPRSQPDMVNELKHALLSSADDWKRAVSK